MAKIKRNGNGDFVLSKRNLAILTIVVTIIGMVAGMAIAWGSMTQAFADHATDANIHWSKTALDDAFVPRGELVAEFKAIHTQLDRIESKL